MFKRSSTHRAVCQALFLIAAIIFQGLALPGTGVVFAKAANPDMKNAAGAPLSGLFEPQKTAVAEPQKAPAPNAPQAANIAATLTDNVTLATKVAPGANINYTATITNNGAASPADDATSVNFSAPLDANTTLVAGSVHASPIARNDTYNWVGNTQLDTAARALPAVISNDVAVNAPGGTDTFTLTAIAGGATSLGGTVTLASPSGAFTYTPPLGRPNIADGASVNDTFTYTISNSADPTLTATGTVTITLTGRVWYLQAGAAGNGLSDNPSSSPSAISTAADKSTDIFYIFANAGSLNGLFTVDAGQQLVGQGVNLVVNIPTLGNTTLFSAAAPTPTTTNTTGNCVTLAGAPGNNTLSGFNIGNCSGLAIQGSNVGTLNVSTMSINTTGGGLDLTGVSTPTVNVVLSGLTATGGTVGANLVGMNGTITLAGGTLSGASGSEFAVNGGAATISYTGAITQNNAQRVVNLQGTSGGSVTLSGTITGGASSLGVHIGDTSTVNGNVTFTTLNLGTSGARMTNQAVTITNGGSGATYGLGTASIFTNNASGIVATNFDGTLNCSSASTVDSSNATAINIDGPAGLTTLGMSLTSVNSAGGTADGISIQDTNGSFTITGDGSNTSVGGNSTGGTISGKSGADASTTSGIGVYLNNVSNITLRRMTINGTNQNYGIRAFAVNNMTLEYSTVGGTNGTTASIDNYGEGSVYFGNATNNGIIGTGTFTNNSINGGRARNMQVVNGGAVGALTLTVKGTTFGAIQNFGDAGDSFDVEIRTSGSSANVVFGGTNAGEPNTLTNAVGNITSFAAQTGASLDIQFKNNTLSNNNVNNIIGGSSIIIQGTGQETFVISGNTMRDANGSAIAIGKQTGGTLSSGQIVNNVVGVSGIADSGSKTGNGIFISASGGGTISYTIKDNTIQQIHGNSHIYADNTGGSYTANFTIDHNTFNNWQGTNFAAIAVTNGAPSSSDTVNVCAKIGGTTAGEKNTFNLGANLAVIVGSSGAAAGHTFNLPTYAGGANATNIQNFIAGNNTMNGASNSAYNDAPATLSAFTGSGTSCPTPLLLALGGVEWNLGWLSEGSIFNRNSATQFTDADVVSEATTINPVSNSLTQPELDSIVAAAMNRWANTGLRSHQIASMRALTFDVADLPGSYLSEADGNTILVDRSGSGKGWFVDATPYDDSEFGSVTSTTRRYSDPNGAPAGHVDLLTAIEHEVGHKLDLDDSYAAKDRDSIMYGYLTVGERRLPVKGQAANAVSSQSAKAPFPGLMPSYEEDRTQKTVDTRPAPRSGAMFMAPAPRNDQEHGFYKYSVPTRLKDQKSEVRSQSSEIRLANHAVRRNFNAPAQKQNAPASGETVSLNTIATFPAGGKSITIKYSATVNTPPLARSVQTQGTVTANAGAISVLTTDPETGTAVPTKTNIDTTMTWNGATSTDWNTITNWTQPASGTQYAPGVSNPAVNDVVIPNVGNQPSIATTDIGVFSLNIANGRTLTIGVGRALNIGSTTPTGGDLTLDGIISGGSLNFGNGTHNINNAGGTGSLSSTNQATVISGSTVTLLNNLQAGALAVNAGGSMIITSRTLSLNGSGAALAVPGGATFTTSGSTVVFNGTAAQTAAGIAYNNLTINNSIGTNVTGVTLTGNATVNGALALTSSDLDTGAFTLTQPNTTASTGVSDVVGTVTRTGGPFALATTLTFGNPNNLITFTVGANRPTTLTVVLAKTAPATYAAAVTRNYTISQTGTNNSTATLRLRYLDPSELNGNTEAQLNLRRFRAADSHWVAQLPSTVNAASNYVESTTVAAADLPTQWTFSSFVPTATGGVVTGRIVDNNGAPVEGAVVRLSGTQNRKFITDANGVYRFENVETTGFYTVTPSRANYSFNPASRSFSQIGETTEAAFGATVETSNLRNPLDTPEYFVRQHYIDFLGREPDEAGFNFWSDQILSCDGDQMCISRKRENVSAAYFLSIEFQQTGGLVDGLYRASYGIRPDFAQFMPDTHTVGLGVQVGKEGWDTTLEANKVAFINAFVNRPTFVGVYGNMDNSLFVDTLIGHTGVSFTAGERDALVSGLGTGTMTRAEALRSIAENNRFVNAKFNDAFVMMEYFGYLRRDPDAGGFAFWLDKLNHFSGNFEQAEMVKAFIVSGEYRDRFPR